jgi:hypothetical protein
VDREARDLGGASSRLSDRRPVARVGKEAAAMLVGDEAAEDGVDGRSLLDEIAREGGSSDAWWRR